MHEATVLGPVGRACPRLDRRCGQPLVDDALFHDDFALAEVGFLLGRPPLHDVRPGIGKQQHLVSGARLRIDDDRQRVVVDDDQLGRVGRLISVLGDDRDDGLTDVPHRPLGHERTAHRLGKARVDVRREPELGQIVAREDGDHPWSGLRLVDVDRDDVRVRLGRADVREPRRVVEGEVVDVDATRREHSDVFDALHSVAEDARAHPGPSVVDYCRHYDSEPDTPRAAMADPSADASPPRPVLLTDELKAQLGKVSTATLTQQLQGRGIRNAFLSGLKPVVEGQRMVGYAHTLRYVPAREDLTDLTRGQNAQRRADREPDARRGADHGRAGSPMRARSATSS